MHRLLHVFLSVSASICLFPLCPIVSGAQLKAGAAAVRITPYGKNPDWQGPVTPTGVWGSSFEDTNKNGRWDVGEPFSADAASVAIDAKSASRYSGIYLAGFGNDRVATGMHDELWARALVLEYGGKRVAFVSLDLIGYSQDSGYFGLEHAKTLLDPALHIQTIVLTCTHNHEGPDTIGLWGASADRDGKFPLYLQFIDRQIAKAITLAAHHIVPVRMKLGVTNPLLSPSLADMQTRTDGRPPRFFDEELRVMQFVEAQKQGPESAVATLVNWNTHPESLEDENTILTSDFPDAVRSTLEEKYGGTAIYVSGDLGAVEIVGDNNRSTRSTFDGQEFRAVPGNKAAAFSFARTEAIGRDVAKAAIQALDSGEWSHVSGIDVREGDLRSPMDNQGYSFLMNKGVLAKPVTWSTFHGTHVVTKVFVITIGDAQIITAPGELFPEIFYGVAKYRRKDCPAADTGRAPEPALRPLMKKKYKFVFGLSPDELGYLVPGYDFHPPMFNAASGLKEATDACQADGVPTHYHETNSASSQLAAAYACTAARLLTGRPVKQSPCKELEDAAPTH